MFGSIGPMELMLIFLVVLLIFGADRLPELARGLGKGLREFRKAANEVRDELMLDELSMDLDQSIEEKSSSPADETDAYPPPVEEEMPEELPLEGEDSVTGGAVQGGQAAAEGGESQPATGGRKPPGSPTASAGEEKEKKSGEESSPE